MGKEVLRVGRAPDEEEPRLHGFDRTGMSRRQSGYNRVAPWRRLAEGLRRRGIDHVEHVGSLLHLAPVVQVLGQDEAFLEVLVTYCEAAAEMLFDHVRVERRLPPIVNSEHLVRRLISGLALQRFLKNAFGVFASPAPVIDFRYADGQPRAAGTSRSEEHTSELQSH